MKAKIQCANNGPLLVDGIDNLSRRIFISIKRMLILDLANLPVLAKNALKIAAGRGNRKTFGTRLKMEQWFFFEGSRLAAQILS